MAFNMNYLGRVSTSANTDALKVWTYNATATGTNEAIATVIASGYFNAAQQNLTAGKLAGLFAVGDVIMIHGNDASGMYIVNAITTNVTVVAFASAGVIDTANLADGAVTAAKLDTDAVETAKILNANVTLAKLAAGIAPSHVVKYASQVTSVGGAAAEAFTVTGVAATDLAFVQVVADGTSNVTVLQAVCTLNTLTITFSADPGNDTVVNYQILRAAA